MLRDSRVFLGLENMNPRNFSFLPPFLECALWRGNAGRAILCHTQTGPVMLRAANSRRLQEGNSSRLSSPQRSSLWREGAGTWDAAGFPVQSCRGWPGPGQLPQRTRAHVGRCALPEGYCRTPHLLRGGQRPSNPNLSPETLLEVELLQAHPPRPLTCSHSRRAGSRSGWLSSA